MRRRQGSRRRRPSPHLKLDRCQARVGAQDPVGGEQLGRIGERDRRLTQAGVNRHVGAHVHREQQRVDARVGCLVEGERVATGLQGVDPEPLERVARRQQVGVEREATGDVEATDADHVADRHRRVTDAMDAGNGVQPTDSRLELVELHLAGEVDLVEDYDVGERDLLARLA